MTRSRPTAAVIAVIVSLTVGAPAALGKPKRLWYKIAVHHTATIDATVTTQHYDGTGTVRSTDVIADRGSTSWTVKSEEGLLVRKRPRGAFSFRPNYAVASVKSERTMTTVWSGWRLDGAGVYVAPCIARQVYRVSGPAVGDIAHQAPNGLSVTLGGINGTATRPAGSCVYERMVSSEPELVTESWPAAKLTTVVPLVTTTLGNPGYGHTVQLRLGPAFGKRRIVRTVDVRTPLTQELQRTPLIYSRQDGDIRARYRVVFTRCRGTAPC